MARQAVHWDDHQEEPKDGVDNHVHNVRLPIKLGLHKLDVETDHIQDLDRIEPPGEDPSEESLPW